MSLLLKYLTVFGMAMLPVVELRAAIPYGIALDLNPFLVYALSVLGNMLPAPFIILFIRRIFEWMKTKSEFLRKLAEKMEAKAAGKIDKVRKYEMLGLFIFVAIPAPGTGAWTGALIAAMLEMRLKQAIPPIFLGVVTAGVIMLAISGGISMLV